MTAGEGKQIAALKQSIDLHCGKVDTLIAVQEERCKHCQAKLTAHDLDINGRTPPDELAPGLKEDMRSLKQSRTAAKRDLRIAWGAIAGLLGAPHLWNLILEWWKGGR